MQVWISFRPRRQFHHRASRLWPLARWQCGQRARLQRYAAAHHEEPWIADTVTLTKTGKTFSFALTQFQYPIDQDGDDGSLEGEQAERRELICVGTLEDWKKNPNFAKIEEEEATKGLTLYPGFKYEGYAWGMSIDLNKCVGCNACVAACAAENNTPSSAKSR